MALGRTLFLGWEQCLPLLLGSHCLLHEVHLCDCLHSLLGPLLPLLSLDLRVLRPRDAQLPLLQDILELFYLRQRVLPLAVLPCGLPAVQQLNCALPVLLFSLLHCDQQLRPDLFGLPAGVLPQRHALF
jgi:hypothetical protein